MTAISRIGVSTTLFLALGVLAATVACNVCATLADPGHPCHRNRGSAAGNPYTDPHFYARYSGLRCRLVSRPECRRALAAIPTPAPTPTPTPTPTPEPTATPHSGADPDAYRHSYFYAHTNSNCCPYGDTDSDGHSLAHPNPNAKLGNND